MPDPVAIAPPPHPYDPDRWARRWGLVGGILAPAAPVMGIAALVLGSIQGNARFDASEVRWWPVLAPLIGCWLGVRASIGWTGARRGVAIFIAGLFVLVGPTIGHFMLGALLGAPFGIGSPMSFLAGGAIAAASHVQREHRGSTAARVLGVVGGILLLVSLTPLPVFSLFETGTIKPFVSLLLTDVPFGLTVAAILALSLLGIAGAVPASRWRCNATRAAATVMVALSLHFGVWEWLAERGGERGILSLLEGLAFAATRIGGWILCAVGLAAWIEGRIAARGGASDARVLDDVFR